MFSDADFHLLSSERSLFPSFSVVQMFLHIEALCPLGCCSFHSCTVACDYTVSLIVHGSWIPSVVGRISCFSFTCCWLRLCQSVLPQEHMAHTWICSTALQWRQPEDSFCGFEMDLTLTCRMWPGYDAIGSIFFVPMSIQHNGNIWLICDWSRLPVHWYNKLCK